MATRLLLLFIASLVATMVNGHGRLVGPASRGSAWRQGFKTPVDYNDEGLYCGGYSVSIEQMVSGVVFEN